MGDAVQIRSEQRVVATDFSGFLSAEGGRKIMERKLLKEKFYKMNLSL